MGLKYLSYLVIVLSFVYILGCDNQQASYEESGVGGIIIDSATKKGLPGVSVVLDQAKTSTLTDSNGFYYIGHIGVPSSAGNYYITFSKSGYNTIKSFAILYAGDTTRRVNYAMLNATNSQVFIANNLIVSEYENKWSMGILNFYHLFVTNDSIWYDDDAVLLDSAGTNTNFSFHAGGYAQPVPGWDTRFTNLLGYYSQYDFDTLSRIDVGARPINPNTDFPTQRTNSFNAPLSQSPVYGFYLLGRYNYDPGYPRVYGLLRIENFYYDNASNTYKAVVDVKINRSEQNYFLLN
ncbi:MAG: carboxypeptidase-like regulatory domain-containing protein [Ignavibacteriota bacterium]|nr:carboxypeptidase regulatory-like domain-containing protein [Ignavibacteriota bacterium]